MFAAFDQLGPALCPPGWYASLLGEDFSEGIAVLLAAIAGGGGDTARIEDAQERVWSVLSNRYYLDQATTEQLGRIRTATDRDLRRAASELVAFGALVEDDETLHLSPATEKVLRTMFALVQPGDQIAQMKVTLLDTDPPVWRRLLVPMTLRLDRLDRVIQAAMGWTNSHLHMFIHPTGHYGTLDLDFPMHDERKTALRDLPARAGDTFGCWSNWYPPSRPGDTRPARTVLVPAHRKTAAAPPATRSCSTRSPTHTIVITMIYDDGWVLSRAATSIPYVSTPPTPTAVSSP